MITIAYRSSQDWCSAISKAGTPEKIWSIPEHILHIKETRNLVQFLEQAKGLIQVGLALVLDVDRQAQVAIETP
jgi:hypothetical protein